MKRILAFAALALGLMILPAQAQATSHEIDLKIVNTSCTAAGCTVTLSRATGTCPADGSITGLTATMSTQVLNPVVASTGTTWTYGDFDTALTAGATYCYWSNGTNAAGTAMPVSNTWQATIPLPAPAKSTLSGTVVK